MKLNVQQKLWVKYRTFWVLSLFSILLASGVGFGTWIYWACIIVFGVSAIRAEKFIIEFGRLKAREEHMNIMVRGSEDSHRISEFLTRI